MINIYRHYLDIIKIEGIDIVQVVINKLYKPFLYMHEKNLYILFTKICTIEDFLEKLKTHIKDCYYDLGTAGILTNKTNNRTISLIFILAVYIPYLKKLQDLSKIYCFIKKNKKKFYNDNRPSFYIMSDQEFDYTFNNRLLTLEDMLKDRSVNLKNMMRLVLHFFTTPKQYKGIELDIENIKVDCSCEICKKINSDFYNITSAHIDIFAIKISHLL